MPISNFDELKKNPIFIALNEEQAKYDTLDDVFKQAPFTRSPLHTIQFLIFYAGLSPEQKTHVLSGLDCPTISQEGLDQLLLDIEWKDLLNNPANNILTGKICVPSPKALLDSLYNCSKLQTALQVPNSLIEINASSSEGKVSIETLVTQNETWLKPFDRDSGFWSVEHFTLSPALGETIRHMRPRTTTNIGHFNIKKGSDEIQLKIQCPESTDSYTMTHESNVNRGIYNAFMNIKDIYGLKSIDDIQVKLSSEAAFSRDGAFVYQESIACLEEQCARLRLYDIAPTIITVQNILAFFQGVDIFVNFSHEVTSSTFDSNTFIELHTKEQDHQQTKMLLLPSSPNPNQAFSFSKTLGSQRDSDVYELKKEPSTIEQPSFFRRKNASKELLSEKKSIEPCAIL